MTRHAGQVRTREAVGGLAAALVVVALVVALSEALLLPAERLPDLPEPADPVAGCPDGGAGVASAVPRPVTSAALFACPDGWDGLRVRFEGEVVGVVLRRDDRAWVQLNDDPYGLALGPLPAHRTALGGNSGIAVSVPEEVADRLAHVGGHRAQGDVLAVVGTFLRADPADGGGPSIQADAAEVARPGRVVRQPVDGRRMAVAGLGVAVVLALLWRVRRAAMA